MSTPLRMLGALAALCLTILGLLSVFDIVSNDLLSAGAGKIMLGIGVLFAAVLVFKMLGAGQKSGETEPPPTL